MNGLRGQRKTRRHHLLHAGDEAQAKACDYSSYLDFLSTPEGWLSSFVLLEPYQRRFLQDPSPLRGVLKSRQVGFSWLFAAEALALTQLCPHSLAIFVSFNREEAQEKVRYALEIYEKAPEGWKRKLVRKSQNALEFEGGSRILSFPCRPPRGKSQAWVYLDEIAFYREGEALFYGSLPVTSRGGRITLASTPFGRQGVFWQVLCPLLEVSRGIASYIPTSSSLHLSANTPGLKPWHSVANKRLPLSLHIVPWWHCSWLCNDPSEALLQAEGLTTQERVQRYGSTRLRRLFEVMELSAFQQEYECVFLDPENQWLSPSEISSCVHPHLSLESSLNALYHHPGPLYAGYDVGRTHHPSELVVLEAVIPQGPWAQREGEEDLPSPRLLKETPPQLRVCYLLSLSQVEYAMQQKLLETLLGIPSLERLCIDATGLGGPLTEALQTRYPLRVEPVVFTAKVKEQLAVGLKVALQQQILLLPPHRDLLQQLQSVRQELLSGRLHFSVSAKDHHADRFWALALALRASERRWGAVEVQRIR